MLMLGASATLSVVVFLLASMISKKVCLNTNNSSPFECGINSTQAQSKPLSIRFFMLGVIFLVFDVELLLMYPVLIEWFKYFTFTGSPMFLSFLIVVTWGLFWEWLQSSLNWTLFI